MLEGPTSFDAKLPHGVWCPSVLGRRSGDKGRDSARLRAPSALHTPSGDSFLMHANQHSPWCREDNAFLNTPEIVINFLMSLRIRLILPGENSEWLQD